MAERGKVTVSANAMTTPTVIEIARPLEPVGRDTFVDPPRQAPPRIGLTGTPSRSAARR
jgi:hypothetical protein